MILLNNIRERKLNDLLSKITNDVYLNGATHDFKEIVGDFDKTKDCFVCGHSGGIVKVGDSEIFCKFYNILFVKFEDGKMSFYKYSPLKDIESADNIERIKAIDDCLAEMKNDGGFLFSKVEDVEKAIQNPIKPVKQNISRDRALEVAVIDATKFFENTKAVSTQVVLSANKLGPTEADIKNETYMCDIIERGIFDFMYGQYVKYIDSPSKAVLQDFGTYLDDATYLSIGAFVKKYKNVYTNRFMGLDKKKIAKSYNNKVVEEGKEM